MIEMIVGIMVGFVLGLTGAGGSVFAVPLFIFVLGFPPSQAIGLSLGAVAIASLLGTATRIRSGNIAWLPALVYAAIGAVFAPMGQWANQAIDPQLLMVLFGVLVVIIALRMWQQASKKPETASVVRASRSESLDHDPAVCRVNQRKPFAIGIPCVLGVSGGAIVTGLLSGLFGVGGGFLIVPTLLYLTGISIQQAVATSLVVIAAISSAGFVSYLVGDNVVPINTFSLVALGCGAGIAIGTLLSKKMAGPLLQKSFSVMMLITAAITLFNSL